jgi:hypothetical protein
METNFVRGWLANIPLAYNHCLPHVEGLMKPDLIHVSLSVGTSYFAPSKALFVASWQRLGQHAPHQPNFCFYRTFAE